MGVDFLGVDFLGVDILEVDIVDLPRRNLLYGPSSDISSLTAKSTPIHCRGVVTKLGLSELHTSRSITSSISNSPCYCLVPCAVVVDRILSPSRLIALLYNYVSLVYIILWCVDPFSNSITVKMNLLF